MVKKKIEGRVEIIEKMLESESESEDSDRESPR